MGEHIAKVIKVIDLLTIQNLNIPHYQRPYKWSVKNVNQLIDDIVLFQKKSAYRLGTIVMHNENIENQTVLNLVDGQQRSITITLIYYALLQYKKETLYKLNYAKDLIKTEPHLLKSLFTNDITKYNIQNNYREIVRRVTDFDEALIDFFLRKCEFVKVELYDISEAFQFFDSQNARGKDLEPHDLLKAYHLRELNNKTTESNKINIVSQWENASTVDLANLFGNYLFRIRNWSKGYSARFFTKNEVEVFKGFNPQTSQEPHTQLFKIGHFYIDEYNNEYHRNIDNNKVDYPFQIDQTIINGKRFFELVNYYLDKIEEVKKIHLLSEEEELWVEILKTINSYEGMHRTGDQYVKNLFECTILYFTDKFGIQYLPKAIEKLFIWAYSVRLNMELVGVATVDNYALTSENGQLFKKIREAIHPSEILNLSFASVEKNRSTKTEKIVNLFIKMNYFHAK
jgi:hypothetical protein